MNEYVETIYNPNIQDDGRYDNNPYDSYLDDNKITEEEYKDY
jgi:hypothetical protein